MGTNSILELLRRSEITSKAHYNAGRRLERHGWAAQWTLAFLAVGQIIISLVPALKLRTNFGEGYLAFASVLFAVLVLAYSLLLGMTNSSARAVLMHDCGLELGRLSRKLYQLNERGNVTQAEYDACAKHYYDILEKHENHTYTDYMVAHYDYYEALASALQLFSKEWWAEHARLAFARIRTYGLHALQFSHYAISLGVMYTWIYFLVRR
jgi:hypothetical protein